MTPEAALQIQIERYHVQRGKLDEGYLRHWAAELGLASELESALSGALKPKLT